jgi:predicted ATPase/class 3 adenylate cyclase
MISPGTPAVFPTGTLALVFTDIEGSTRLWERCGNAMREALRLHDALMRRLLARTSGYEVKTAGDSFMVAFSSVHEAVRWCLDVQEALPHEPWPEELLTHSAAAVEGGSRGLLHRGLRVRMGVHVGEPEHRVDPHTGRVDYIGRMVNATARVADAGHGGQVLVSGPAWAQVEGTLEALGRPAVRHLGEFRLKGLENPMPLVEVLPASLAARHFPALRAPEERRGNVPGEVEAIIGRTAELECLRRWLDEGTRLITLLGPGGMGKTRLATHFAVTQLEARAWDGGVWLCDVSEVRTAEDLCHVVGRTLGVALLGEGPESDPVARLGRALAGWGAPLVILDNVEQLIAHLPATVGRWLSLAPRARFLLTSREVSGLPGERVLDLAPLGLAEEDSHDLETIARSEAVRLFVQRAQALRSTFVLTAEEAPLVAAIVRRLDGIALAIELAAARTSLLSVAQLHERLSRRFELLRSGRRGASSRQATLWGAIDWSWNLLESTEQAALAQCAVFHGGFMPEAAEAVLALPPWGPDALELLQSLRAKSLLRAWTPEGLAGEPRLGMYESIREYASARLAETGTGASVRMRHADFYVTRALALRDQARGGGGLQALRRLALERDNLLAACDHSLAVPSPTPESVSRLLRGLVALEPDVAARGPAGLLLPRLNQALALAASVPVEPLLRAEALAVRGRSHLEAGQPAAARADLEAARDAFEALGAVARRKQVLVDLSIVARHEGNLGAAWERIQEARALAAGDDPWLEAYTVGNLGLVEQERRGAEAAIPHLRAALELFRAVGDAMQEANFLINLSLQIGEAGRAAEAMPLLEEAMAKALSVGYRVGYFITRMNLGCILLGEDRAEEAREHLETADRMGRQLGARILEGTARGELGRGSLVLGALEAARRELTEAIALLGPVSRLHVLRFTAWRAAAEALAGRLPAARRDFAELEAAPELRDDPVLRALVSLLRATVDLAELRAAPPDSEEARHAARQAHQRLEAARSAPVAAASSDLRGALRLLERWRS